MMNIFRLAGDISHVVAIFILLAKIWNSRSAAGEDKEKGEERLGRMDEPANNARRTDGSDELGLLVAIVLFEA